MKFVLMVALGWLMYWLVALLLRGLRWVWRRGRAHIRARREALRYAVDPQRALALALAHPVAATRVGRRFTDPAWRVGDRDDLARQLGPVLLHVLGLRAGLDDTALRAAVAARLGDRWYRLDLDDLQAQDDPADALAFACARTAFCTRLAGLLGWIDEASQWRILAQNAARAADCFAGWQEYGAAWARGRRQWVAASRDDSLGLAFDEADVRGWLADAGHPWQTLPWNAGRARLTPP
ncbi:DUF1266 domain-containing protein [Pseudorhodoferax sp.]|uniref:DUF1266 domain-containing protein n=1 Tax=Pseudorhodoferax sp. TaxID=1993553 RepID=UPI002DD6941A|nr:DUF1266 domain-containing protein [Pseudorhodoferax sp.]